MSNTGPQYFVSAQIDPCVDSSGLLNFDIRIQLQVSPAYLRQILLLTSCDLTDPVPLLAWLIAINPSLLAQFDNLALLSLAGAQE